MSRSDRQLVSRAAVFTFAFALTSGVASAQLPDGPGKDAMVKVCSPCHEANRAAASRLTREGWEQTVSDMRWRGAKGTDEEFAQVIEYLVTNFLGEAPAKLNMNRATAVELESVVLLLRKEAAALIAYRDKVGGFKTIDDIKKAPGVDFKKIEAAKDRITF
ncbi:MAG TPA: helix-hairpin-helix domain-containing protein [Vicinamibacterales bacterium]|nr:helix-hairpin-helix domain-containing protein [Vicinamibacterales bacterium]